MEFDRVAEMRQEILGAVPPWIQMELVMDSFSGQLFVHLACPGVETILILITAVDVDGSSLQLDLVFSSKVEGVVLLPMRDINRIAENQTEQVSKRSGVLEIGIQLCRCLRDQSWTLSAHRTKKLRMRKRQPQCAISTHGETSNPAGFAAP